MNVIEWVDITALGPVRNHNHMENFARELVLLGATQEENAVTASVLASRLNIDKKTVYNRLARPGFVKVDSGQGAISTFYYLLNDRFGDLAKTQQAEYYPRNLGPLALDKIPKVVERDLSKRTKTVDIRGTSTAKDDVPVVLRTIAVSNSHMRTIIQQAPDYGSHIQQVLSDPTNNLALLENMMTLLGGVWRWVDRFNASDIEKQMWLRGEIRDGSENQERAAG